MKARYPGVVSRRTSSKLTVHVFAALSPTWTRPIGSAPVSATQPFTIFTPSRYRSHAPAARRYIGLMSWK